MAQNGATKVAILGGGPAGVAAAFWLSAPEQNGRYQVTLYAQGWRLGGKCASGRNAEHSERIEEHGLHMLLGCYQNAFATLRACYDEWTPPPSSPIKTWTDAFIPQRHVTLMETDGPGGAWAPWDFPNLPRWPGEPGDGAIPAPEIGIGVIDAVLSALDTPDPSRMQILRLADWLENQVRVHRLIPAGAAAVAALRAAAGFAPLAAAAAAIRPAGAPDLGRLAAEAPIPLQFNVLEEANRELVQELQSRRPAPAGELSEHVDAVAFDLVTGAERLLVLANLGVAAGWGYVRDIVLKGGGDAAYDALDAQDFRAWLASCGASETTLASAPVRAIYDLTFAFPDGLAEDIANGSIAAGVTLRFAMEMVFGYRDAPLWKMSAGMGDVVFTPFYEVLQARASASVQFFSRVTDLRADANGAIGEIDISVQAVTADGAPYRPLVVVKGLGCWPNQPDWTQLKNGVALKGADFESTDCKISVRTDTLKLGADFDLVVLAIPPAAIQIMRPSFVPNAATWTAALAASRSVATQSLQLWLAPDVNQLGWSLGPTVLTAFAEPYDSWGDMAHVLHAEAWTGPGAPQALGYFCGCLAIPVGAPVTPAAMLARATGEADGWLKSALPALWPAYQATEVVERYDRANYDVSELYVQTPAGANASSRLSAAAPAGFANLYAVGDWTKTRFSGGCFESAIESGMLASRAISGVPAQIKTS